MEHDDELAMLVGTLVKTGQTLLKSQRGEFIPFVEAHDAGAPATRNLSRGNQSPYIDKPRTERNYFPFAVFA